MSKHTPGPWHRNIPPARKYQTVWAGRNTHVAALTPNASMSDEELEANIDLIVAAPDMFDSLDPDTLDAIADEIHEFKHSARAASLRRLAKRQRAAIAKVTGSSCLTTSAYSTDPNKGE